MRNGFSEVTKNFLSIYVKKVTVVQIQMRSSALHGAEGKGWAAINFSVYQGAPVGRWTGKARNSSSCNESFCIVHFQD